MTFLKPTLLSCLVGTLLLTACSPEKPWLMEQSVMIPQKIALVESRHIVKKPLTELSDSEISAAATKYKRSGAGPLYVVVAYKDHGKLSDSAITAQADKINTQLQNAGVPARDIVISKVPLETSEPVALIAFDTLEAQRPQNCTEMPGMSRMVENDYGQDYKLGCGVKEMMARQIADPRDLEGRAGLGGGADGDHAANVISEQYKPGAPRDFLPSYVISELAGTGG